MQGLLRPDRLSILLPRADMPLQAQLNAVARFALVYALLLLLFGRARLALAVVVLAAALTIAVHQADVASDERLQRRMEALAVERDPVTQQLRVAPTRDNPFMNVLVGDHARFANRPPAADLLDARVAARVERAFDHNLYRDQSDVFHRNSSSRAFYTTPYTTIPNDQSGFARWLYDGPPTCKEAGTGCVRRLHHATPGR